MNHHFGAVQDLLEQLDEYLDDYIENYDETKTGNSDSDHGEPDMPGFHLNEHIISYGTLGALYLCCAICSFSLLKKRFQALMTLKAILMTISSLMGLTYTFARNKVSNETLVFQEYIRSLEKHYKHVENTYF